MGRPVVSHTDNLDTLAEILSLEVHHYQDTLRRHNVGQPSLRSLGKEAPFNSDELERSKQVIVHACEKITALTKGPSFWLLTELDGYITTAAISVVVGLKVPHFMSSDADAPSHLSHLSEATGASQELLRRLLRYLTQRFIFQEIAPLQYTHNAVSAMLQEPSYEAWANLSSVAHRSSAFLLDLLEESKFQIPDDPRKSAFSKAFQTDLDIFGHFRQRDPERGKMFALAMTAVNFDTFSLYPYQSLPQGSTLVDVGGGSGHISARILQQHPGLRCIVQDLEETIRIGKSRYTLENLEWQVHDFFGPQPIQGAEIYLLRRVLHDHPDHAAVRILGRIADAMTERSCLLVDDLVLPDAVGEDSDRLLNARDLIMLCAYNGKERALSQWEKLVSCTERQLEITRVWRGADKIRGGALLEIRLKSL